MGRTDYLNDPTAPSANSIKVAVSAVVLDARGRILMIHRTDNNLYSIPGGGLEAGETVTDAVVREVHEETGRWMSSPSGGARNTLRSCVFGFMCFIPCWYGSARAHRRRCIQPYRLRINTTFIGTARWPSTSRGPESSSRPADCTSTNRRPRSAFAAG
ncbi:NUDIX hydrolase [Nocardia bhagyanarayanae]|uniref:NUDIX hydrolase n=1 Tax=Nocardia bhagyanarayanae TaxID=1215925 RepID=UPI00114E38B5|nr:NUDIX hydrolase [Nocardia bhagyanarayanae]